MTLIDIETASDESAWYQFFHGRRFVSVRYIDGPSGKVIRTQAEAERTAALALVAQEGLHLTVR